MEPATISKLVQGSLVEMVISIVNRGIKTHAWDKLQLVTFRKELSRSIRYHHSHKRYGSRGPVLMKALYAFCRMCRGNAISEVAGTTDEQVYVAPGTLDFPLAVFGHDKVFITMRDSRMGGGPGKRAEARGFQRADRDIAQDPGSTPEEKPNASCQCAKPSRPLHFRIVFPAIPEVDQARAACAQSCIASNPERIRHTG